MVKKDEVTAVTEPVLGIGKEPAVVSPEAPVPPKPEEPTVPKSQHTNLQEAHNKALDRIKALEGDGGRLQKLEDGFSILSRGLEMQQAEQTAATIVRYTEEGNTQAADELAEREMNRRLASMGLTWDDPALVNVRPIKETSAAKAYTHFISVQPALGLRQPIVPAAEIPPVNNPGDTPPQAEKIGGKTLEDLKLEWAKESGLLNTATPQPAGIGADVNTLNPNEILKLAIQQKES